MLLKFESKSQILLADFSRVELEAVKQLRHGCSRHVHIRALRVNCSLGVTADAERDKNGILPALLVPIMGNWTLYAVVTIKMRNA